MLMWETASICVLLGNESEKATAAKYIFLVVFSVLSKFYDKMNKRPGKKSKNFISSQGAYSNHYGIDSSVGWLKYL